MKPPLKPHTQQLTLGGLTATPPLVDLDLLNEPQRAAVLQDSGPLVVFAGAGSGKTRVITTRIARLIRECGIPASRILAVTFTNKAAAEMRERVAKLVGHSVGGLMIGTFHSMCARLLRAHASEVGIARDFTIYDDQDQKALIKRVTQDLGLDIKKFPPKSTQSTINRAKQEMVRPEELPTDGNPFKEITKKIFLEYEARMARAHALDFGDLITRFVFALETHDALRARLSSQFLHVLVDEFQDTNHAQLRLVRALASTHRNLCVVGDDDQSIYRWRGADRRNILDFQRAYPDAALVKLEQNYRSTQRILRIAHAVIQRNIEREPKQMWTQNDEGEPALVVRCEDERDEAQMVVRGAQELQAQGESLDEIAVFYRTHAQSRAIEEALLRADIPYRVVGGVRFFDRAEVKDALAYLRVIHNPADDISLLRIINAPARGIGKTTIDRLMEDASARGVGLWEAILSVEERGRLRPSTIKKVAAFRALILNLQRELAAQPLDQALSIVFEQTGYLALLRAEDTAEADARIENLEELEGSLQLYAQEHEDATLAGFLEDVTLASDQSAQEPVERITLMTVHAAKGLEFDHVMVTGLEEQLFPRADTSMGEDLEELEEERRLAYVAFTRARVRLILSYAATRRLRGRFEVCAPSRFLQEIPVRDAQWLGGEPSPSSPSWGSPSWGSPSWGSTSRSPSRTRSEPPRAPDEIYLDTSEGCDLETLQRGTRVRHRKFGVGEVRSLEQGMIPKARVLFPGWGTKTLAVSFLEPV